MSNSIILMILHGKTQNRIINKKKYPEKTDGNAERVEQM